MEEKPLDLEQAPTAEELRHRRHAIKALIESPGWHWLSEVAHSQIVGREAAIITNNLRTQEDVLEECFMKGERSGIKLFVTLPESVLEQLETELEEAIYREAQDEDIN